MLRSAGNFVSKFAQVLRRAIAIALVIVFAMVWTVAVHAPALNRRAIAAVSRSGDRTATHTVARSPIAVVASSAPDLLHAVPVSARMTSSRSPAIKPTTNPAIRGLYTGAAKSRIVWMDVTAYCPCTICCGPLASGVTASGKGVGHNGGQFVAADPGLFPFGTCLSIPGYADDQIVEVIDRGSAIIGHRLDVFFPTHEQAAEWGRKWLAVKVGR